MVDPAYYNRTKQIESGGNYRARNPSGAWGAWQFMPATAQRYGLRHGVAAPAEQDAAMRRLTADNYAYLEKHLGRAPKNWELYLAHQQGAGGATKLLTGERTAALSRNQLANNPFKAKTAGDWLDGWEKKYNGGAPSQIAMSAQNASLPESPSEETAVEDSETEPRNPYGRGFAGDLIDRVSAPPVIYHAQEKQRIPTFDEIYARFA